MKTACPVSGDEARWTWRIASASFLVALLSLGAFLSCSRTEEPALTQFPSDMEEVTPGWAWTTVPAIVRQERSLQAGTRDFLLAF